MGAHEPSAVRPPASSNGYESPDNGREELVRSHLPLVRAIARRYGGRGEEFDDLVQVGALGLVKASGRFDPTRGTAFASFAAPAVEGEIRRHLRERGPGLRLPRETQRMSTELKRSRAELAAALGRSPTVQEVAAALGADVADVERLIAAEEASDPIAISTDGEADERSDGQESTAESEARVLLAGGLRALDERERRIVLLRFHADMTERQIARTVGLSQAHVSRVLEGALTKLRAELTAQEQHVGPGDSSESKVISRGGQAKQREVSHDGPAADEPATPSRRAGRSKPAAGYSGRILVRMPSELHEQLAQAAERDHISLNRYVTQALSSSVQSEDSTAPSRARGLRVALAANLTIVVLAGVIAIALLVLALQRGI